MGEDGNAPRRDYGPVTDEIEPPRLSDTRGQEELSWSKRGFAGKIIDSQQFQALLGLGMCVRGPVVRLRCA